MPVLTRFRLDGGTNQQAARKLLPAEGLLRRVVNLELRRDNELGVRPGFTLLASTLYGSVNPSFHDVFTYDGRLFAFGSPSGGTINTLFEYVDEAKAWRRIQTSIPDATAVRELGAPAEQEEGISFASCAAYDGVVVFAWSTGADLAYVNIFRASDGATLISQQIGGTSMQRPICVTTTGPRIHILGLDATATNIEVLTYVPGTTESFSTPQTIQVVDDDVFAACAVQGSPGGYVTAGVLAGDIVVRHWNDSHVQQMTRTITGLAGFIRHLAVSAEGSSDTILLGYNELDGLPTVKHRTLRLSTGLDIAGPTSFAGPTTGTMTVYRSATSDYVVASYSSTATSGTLRFGGALSFDWEDADLATDFLPDPQGIGFLGVTQGSLGPFRVNGMMEVGDPGRPLWFKDFGTATNFGPDRPGSLCRDSVTGLLYAVMFRENADGERGAYVTEFAHNTRERRQVAVCGGLLHIAGALPLVFDGLQVSEISFGEAPRVSTLSSSNASGSVSNSADYFVQAHAEMIDARGNTHRGPPSNIRSITTGASDDTITGFVSATHSARNNVPGTAGGSYRIRVFRTAALTDKTAGENLYSETSLTVRDPSEFGDGLALTLEAGDSTLRENGETRGTIYIQGQTPIADQAPPPCQYLWTTNERLAAAGLPRTEQWLQSKLRIPGEGIHFSDQDLLQYGGSCDEAIRAIGAIGDNLVCFTRRTISLWGGDGPDHSGQGEFKFRGFLSREGGIVDWRSLVDTDEILLFQRETDQICSIDRSGNVDWNVGQAIRDELVTYPVVVATCHLRRQHAVVFAVEATDGLSGELLVYDLRRKVWSIWDIHAQSVCEYQGRLVYVHQAGVCYQQDSDPGSNAMPDQSFETFDFDFGTGLSWGEILKVGLVGTKDGDCSGALAVTLDSGASYTTIETFALTTANGYTTGKPIELEKTMPDRGCSRFGLRLTITGGSNTRGIRINEVVLETETAPGMARLPARDTK